MMAKVEVSPILADSIRTLRIQKGISSRSIAEAINRSPSYFSKIENGNIKNIEKTELDEIFYAIAGNDRGLDEQIDSLYATLKIKYSAQELQEDLWFINYDTVRRTIPIPADLIDDINREMSQLDVSVAYLVERINGNDDIAAEYRTDPEHVLNEWKSCAPKEHYIKMFLAKEQVEEILTYKVKTSNYVTILSIVYYLKKIEKYQNLRELSEGQINELMECAVDYLNSHKFYSLTEKERLLQLAASQEERQRILTSFDKENMALITDMLEGFKVFSEIDVEFTNKQLAAFIANLHWDSGFVLHLIGLPFSELDKISFALKQEMLTEIRSVVKKYRDIPDQEKRIETYK